MNTYNQQMTKAEKPKFSVAITTKGYQKLINNTLGDPERSKRFVASITSAVAVNETLQECDAGTILAGALLGESLNLSPSPQLGQYYLVAFNDKRSQSKKAQFILGYKGYLQLVMRSGQVKKINAVEIKQGELKNFDPLNEEIDVKLIEDWNEREALPTIGYYAFFELTNGFRKAIYWSKEQMMSHADKYSPAFSKNAVTLKTRNGTKTKVSFEDYEAGNYSAEDEWMYSSFWYKQFDEMAKKTMLRQLISKGGCPMSTEMVQAYTSDNQTLTVNDDNEIVVEAPSAAEIAHSDENTEQFSDEPTNSSDDFTGLDFEEVG